VSKHHTRQPPESILQEAQKQAKQHRSAEVSYLCIDDADAWQELCLWLEQHAQEYRHIYTRHIPAQWRSLLLSSKRREQEWDDLRQRQLLPVLLHDKHGWLLCQNWRERVERLRENNT
jgi:hypothetical protein